MSSKLPLNQGQQAASEGFFEFLLSDEKECIIAGAAGVGKTYLMSHFIDYVMPSYMDICKLMGIKVLYQDVVMTATTNKAAEVLSNSVGRPTQTIQSFLNLIVKDDYRTGKTKLTRKNTWHIHYNQIIFIDECSMIDRELRRAILEGTINCKIVYVGDRDQLAPVMETISPIYKDNLRTFVLTELMRNAEQPVLKDICQQLRETVQTGIFKPIQIVPGVIDWLSGPEMEENITRDFIESTANTRILAYTNSRVQEFNETIREMRQLPEYFCIGERLVNNSAINIDKSTLRVEMDITVVGKSPINEMITIESDVNLEVCRYDLETNLGEVFAGVPVPVDRDHFNALIKYYQGQKNWERYFFLKNNFPDLRQRDAATVHKAQGSTYDSVYIDVGNLSTCRTPDMTARLLYVGFSRAKSRVFLYGDLNEKYGGLVV